MRNITGENSGMRKEVTMKSVPGLIRRFISILFLSIFFLLLLNFLLLYYMTKDQTSSRSPYTTAQEAARGLIRDGVSCALGQDFREMLREENAWAVFIDNDTHRVIWHTEDLPEDIPTEYSLSEIADLTLGYVRDYPTYVGDGDNGIMVLGYPKDRYWKSMWPTWDYDFIANLPQSILTVMLLNLLFFLILYMAANTGLLKSVNPIVKGIQTLPTGEPVYVREKGVLSELAASINHTSEMLQMQQRQLRRKETARANWIAGVSHDIRTPLSMVMGYAGQLAGDSRLPEEEQKKARVIVRQSARMKNLINDLNLASKLEYNMQPLARGRENAVALARQVAVDFINMDIDRRFQIEWTTQESLSACMVDGDRDLLMRAVSNLIQNSINHNEQGCRIYVGVWQEEGSCVIRVEDDGKGASDEQIEKLNHTPHYMVCDTNTAEQRHGLGLLIVRQIAASHGGAVRIGRSSYGGLSVEIVLPVAS